MPRFASASLAILSTNSIRSFVQPSGWRMRNCSIAIRNVQQFAGLVLLLMVPPICGCGGNENLAYVTGTVSLDGEPLPEAFIVFSPTSGGTTAYGRTDDDGQYEMVFNDNQKGAWIGENRVEISTGDVDATGTGGGGAREKVPAAYNRNSNLLVEVTSGNNVHNFDLKSDEGRIIQLPPE